MRKILSALIFCFSLAGWSQQTLMYTQYTFNKAGLNPAAAGTDITQTYNYVLGLNRQWLAFENGPKSNFVNFSYTKRPKRGYRFWQNAGIYIDTEDVGLFTNTGIYLGYAIHMLLRKKKVLSFGLFAGGKRYRRSLFSFDRNDPAIQNNSTAVLLYPDIIPGVRLSNKQFFTGLSVRQITISKLQDRSGNKIGGPSRLSPTIYFEYGRTIEISDVFLVMPSFALNVPIISPPTIDGSLMFYYGNRVGFGLSARNASFASAIFQIRFIKNLTAGFAYSYPINKVRYVAQNSYEFMIGITPLGMNSRLVGVNEIVRCPTLTY